MQQDACGSAAVASIYRWISPDIWLGEVKLNRNGAFNAQQVAC